jgi:hypothetical protein
VNRVDIYVKKEGSDFVAIDNNGIVYRGSLADLSYAAQKQDATDRLIDESYIKLVGDVPIEMLFIMLNAMPKDYISSMSDTIILDIWAGALQGYRCNVGQKGQKIVLDALERVTLLLKPFIDKISDERKSSQLVEWQCNPDPDLALPWSW